jgi:hypothetical protein
MCLAPPAISNMDHRIIPGMSIVQPGMPHNKGELLCSLRSALAVRVDMARINDSFV